ncbi:Glutathione S-transferase [Rhynchospora pubera]|uniref:Glutathione S-transferase n=1 Tax=Rhynchospora pubera TaxID=906938 RepID=A0AAV8CNZ0_9POAL|nr:Glutathione S-transferase [Rhynchospora pubera]
MKFVPALVDGDTVIADSFAIALANKYPQNPLLPRDLKKKALNIQIASIVSSGIQPLLNLVVVSYVEEKLGSKEKDAWSIDQTNRVFTALEKLLKGCARKYATGDEIGLGDVFLAPQLYYVINKLQMDMSNYPTLARLHAAYEEVPAFQAAVPENQPDAPSITMLISQKIKS